MKKKMRKQILGNECLSYRKLNAKCYYELFFSLFLIKSRILERENKFCWYKN